MGVPASSGVAGAGGLGAGTKIWTSKSPFVRPPSRAATRCGRPRSKRDPAGPEGACTAAGMGTGAGAGAGASSALRASSMPSKSASSDGAEGASLVAQRAAPYVFGWPTTAPRRFCCCTAAFSPVSDSSSLPPSVGASGTLFFTCWARGPLSGCSPRRPWGCGVRASIEDVGWEATV